ncbi:MAG: aldehyde dehydrogenase family protein [Bacteroidetes bacterium]|nr:aldehyde dehydrogenase family protein [Bacteroidota bacterium]MDA0903034.1 aldehyde dehydrogenase family protein [Bacteroidota bacterium]MDA1241756.1 aldehyde dehydrogenase family protein [Bacteroidota bacterium]
MDNINALFQLHRDHVASAPTLAQRKEHLRALWSSILNHEEALIDALHDDLGKPRVEVHLHEIYPIKTEIKFALKHLRGWMAPRATSTPLAMIGTRSFIHAEPKGQVLVISPWNFPVMLTLRPLVSALAAGNRVVVKPSEHTPQTAQVLQRIVKDALPESTAAVVLGGPEVSAKLTTLPFQHICFTGGTQIGKLVMRAAADNLASLTLELGGKSPAIVDKTAHVGDASRRLAWGKCLNNGQVCIAPDYLVVDDAVADDLIQQLSKRISAMYGGTDGQHEMMSPHRSKMVNDHHFQRVVGLIEDAINQGATCVHGGTWDAEERRIAPTLLDGCRPDMKVMQEEIFGPVLPILRYKSREERDALLAHHPHPLALYIFSQDSQNIDELMRSTRAGTTGINEVIVQVAQPELPFGGIQNSGMGRTGGLSGFRQFSNERSVVAQRSRFNILPLTFPPFNRRSLWLVRTVQKWL